LPRWELCVPLRPWFGAAFSGPCVLLAIVRGYFLCDLCGLSWLYSFDGNLLYCGSMKFSQTTLPGVWRIDLELREDERGFLARTYCEREFGQHGLNTDWPQCNLTLTKKRGMIRGMHFQAEPKPEIKLIRCAVGAIYDVLVDVRPDSTAFGRWEGFDLTNENRRMLYVPGGFAHGFQCLTDHCEVFYQMSEFYVPELARGIRWNDPRAGIRWPLADPVVSEKDRNLPLL
jgi:dTDP-4-dehydrorhamnose 3,5-epimerase